MEQETIKFLNKAYILAIVLVAVLAIFLLGTMSYQQKSLANQNQNQITVSGEGKVYAKPDVALINLGVTTDGQTVADVTVSNTNKMNAVIDAVKALKVADKDIQTTNYNLSPKYNYTEKSGQVFQGYTLTQNIQVKVRDFSKVGDILTAGTTKGANLVGDLQFTIDNPQQFKNQARAKAIAQAKANAQNLTKTSGIELGKLINVYENSNPSYSMYNKVMGMGGASLDSAAPTPTVQPGQQEIDVTVNLTYQVK